MKYLVVDDEKIIVEGMVDTLKEIVGDNAAIFKAHDPYDAIEQMKLHKADVVFSDVDMPGMNGLKLAEQLHEINPDADIVFATGYAHYSLDAWKTEAKAFILKPVSKEDMTAAIDRILKNRSRAGAQAAQVDTGKPLEVRCFGNFEIFHNNTPVHFARKKSKEMVAYLIDRKGAMISTGELRSALWEEEEDNEEKKGYIRVLANDIRKSMEDIGISNFLRNDMDCYSVDVSIMSCDYLKYLNGDEQAKNSFAEEYMTQYPWAEVTLGVLLDMT
ncbi:Two-component response regulator, SAPR family, consists of REC, wHTH and BTAD domains [Pseudobutyrivibrio sp. OR37]|uniref:response regulator n=1 Tax=Pseudobutyrivibrio sp. OR37 TaxID=1798186 RepID=UPI0008EC434A|nr:response regulator [Pseudobutyrivibrio sp. OR37]SFH52896.1 Two-component response regulator, SAPR family, consists of REC, wHTH and BTAD domains [Pseudobutyrivibrio sp. OR37]